MDVLTMAEAGARSAPPALAPTIMLVVGVSGWMGARLLRLRHWKRVRKDPDATRTGAIWGDVLLRMTGWVCLLLAASGGLGLLAQARG